MDDNKEEVENSGRFVTVYKRNIKHKFIITEDAWVDSFCAGEFCKWENDTFDIFETVKDAETIAIDLGAWLGTTAIWLSKHFFHVIAVEADRLSVYCLKNNLRASECYNVTICDKAIAHVEEPVVFGPRSAGRLNGSTSTIKQTMNCTHDYTVDSVNINRIFEEYIQRVPDLKKVKVSFIKCDIEGGEEGIIEDLLQCVYAHDCKVLISFHITWWSSKKIVDFKDLFVQFATNCPIEDVCSYLEQNPFGSILFSSKNKRADS